MRYFLLLIAVAMIVFSCSSSSSTSPVKDEGDYSFSVSTSKIRSYPNGGGMAVFAVSLNNEFKGSVNLSLQANEILDARLSKSTIKSSDKAFELIIYPKNSILPGDYTAKVVANHSGVNRVFEVKVKIYEKGSFNNIIASEARKRFTKWIEENCRNICDLHNNLWQSWRNNPHLSGDVKWEFLCDDWHAKITYPDTAEEFRWYQMVLRRRNQPDAIIAVKQVASGIITEIDINDTNPQK